MADRVAGLGQREPGAPPAGAPRRRHGAGLTQPALADGITINALAILCRDCLSGRPGAYDLEREYAERIIGGPGAFVITADGRERFLLAVRNKMLREISVAPVFRSRRTAWSQGRD